jgi:hypothetical protein
LRPTRGSAAASVSVSACWTAANTRAVANILSWYDLSGWR